MLLITKKYQFVNISSENGLDRELIERLVNGGLDVHVFDEIESTNQWLIDRLATAENCSILCVAESQVNGRGRAGRVWQSPSLSNIYMSFSYAIHNPQKNMTAISLVIGLAVIHALKSFGVDAVKLKWPNDILLEGKKLAGVLIEAKKVDGVLYLVVGVGLNVRAPENFVVESALGWSDLSAHGLGPVDRSQIIAVIYNECARLIAIFVEKGFAGFKNEWCSVDEYFGKDVVVMDQNSLIATGLESGVDEAGCLLIETEKGRKKMVSGDLSLRKSL